MRKINFIPSLVFEILKVLIDSFDITGHAWPRPLKSHYQFAALRDM